MVSGTILMEQTTPETLLLAMMYVSSPLHNAVRHTNQASNQVCALVGFSLNYNTQLRGYVGISMLYVACTSLNKT